MFFFKNKKLAEIERKLDRITEMLENQKQSDSNRESKNRQFLCEALDKKAEALSSERQCGMNALETELKDTESKISVSVNQILEEIQDLIKDSERQDGAVKKAFKTIQKDVEEEQRVARELVEKLDLTENEIRMLLVNSVMDQLP